MRVLIINEICGYTSTGKICVEIAEKYEQEGHIVKIAYGRSDYVPKQYKKYAVRIGNDWDVRFHALQTRLFDTHGFCSRKATVKFWEWAEAYNPGLVWIHNLHGYYIHAGILFDWLKMHPQLEVRWTLHDCWAFTGHCVHFLMAKCSRWRSGCFSCPQKREYPASMFYDRSEKNYAIKKKAFTGVKKMKIITPSDWLANLVRDSFLGEYPVEVRHNTVNRKIFRPLKSNFRDKYGLHGKIIILGVANAWEKRKGLDDFMQLSKMLDERYAIVLVGLTEKNMKKISNKAKETCFFHYAGKPDKICSMPVCSEGMEESGMAAGNIRGKAVPEGVINLYKAITGESCGKMHDRHALIYCIPRTSDAEELAMLYSASDFFVNPSHEDTFPTTNLEAAACGTFVITYDIGGSKETLYEDRKSRI